MNQTFHLYQLQKIDTQIDQNKTRLQEIEKSLKDSKSVLQAEAEVERAKRKLQQTRQALKSVEEKTRDVVTKIEQSEASLYGGKVRNPKELQDLQMEVASLKKRTASLEDQQLELMLEQEQAEQENEAVGVNLSKVKATDIEQKAGLVGEQAQLMKTNDRLMAERNAIISSVPKENLEIYERLRTQKRGLAVSPIDEGACNACGSVLRPAEIQSARSSQQMVYCSSCGRLLYAD